MVNFAATYYVSNTGSDSNSGLSSSSPWKTLTKVNAAYFKAGDQILFKRGNTFYGSLTVRNSGSSGAPIVYGAYGTGVNPVLTGFTSVKAWTNLGNNIWESSSTVSTLGTCNMVTIRGVNTPMGRTPNLNSYYTFQSHYNNSSITSSNLSGTPNWTGAEVVIRKERWIWQTGKITSQSGGKINYTDEGKFTPRDNWGFFIQNDARTLNAQNEWFYNRSTKKIRVYSSSQPVNVQVASLEYVISSTSRQYVTIDNLTVSGANTTGINITSNNNIVVQNCTVNKCGLEGIRGVYSNSYYKFNNNLVKNCNYSGIHTYSDTNHHETITNNTVDSCAMVIGIGRLYAPGAIFSAAENTLIQYNKVDHSGYNGIMVTSDRGQVRNNFVNHSLENRSDGGGIYTVENGVSLIIDGNIVLNTTGLTAATNNSNPIGVGIYLDFNTSYATVSNNTVANCSEHGIFLHHGTDHNKVFNNTSYNSNISQFGMHDYTSTGSIKNNTVTGNQFVAKKSTQMAANFRSSLNDIPTFMVLADNNIYARPISNDNFIRVGQPNQFIGTSELKNLYEWQSFSGHDDNSRKLLNTITNENDLYFEYNATKTARTVTLSSAAVAMNGTKVGTSIILQPFTSAVLIKDANTAGVPWPPRSVVAVAGNGSAKVTFLAPTSNGGSAITGYRVTSYPAGGIDSNAGSTSLTHTITGLKNGTSYTFTVKATNSMGSSVASAPSNSVFPTLASGYIGATVSDPPTSVVAKAGNGNASVTFVAPKDNGGATITGYYTISNPSGGIDTKAGTTSLYRVINGLKNGVSYTFTVKAINSVGNSAASAPSNSVFLTSSNAVLKSANIQPDQVEPVIGQEVLIDVFPNPTQGRITVRFSTQPIDGGRIDILDIAGRKVASRTITQMAEEFNLQDQAPGLYLVKTILGSDERIQKLNLIP